MLVLADYWRSAPSADGSLASILAAFLKISEYREAVIEQRQTDQISDW